jgi:NAD(P)H-hydrate repair Nnr-like enzyme with NAD(P)H-hydrate dehydratase domain
VVVSGDVSHTGAARLAARGALRAGAGLVTIASPRDALAVNAASNLAVMVRPVDGADELATWLSDPRLNTVVLGPGGGVGQPMREMVLAAWRANERWCSMPTRSRALPRRRKHCLPRSKAGAPPDGADAA